MYWRRKAQVAHVGDDRRIVLLDLDHLERPPLILEDTSALIWCLLESPLDDVALIGQVAEHYDLPKRTVADPVLAFLEDLATRNVAEYMDVP